MEPKEQSGWDLVPLLAAVLTFAMMIVYVFVVSGQDDQPSAWFLGGMTLGAVLAAYGSSRSAPGRWIALTVSGVILVGLGMLGILTIGLPILVAGALALASAARSRGAATAT